MNQPSNIRKVIAASSVGTMIEWYDFYIFGMLSTTISTQFFPKTNPTAALLSTLAIFAAGFIVRPFGALVFGRLGDLIGRKYTFLLTLILMGGSTFLIGCVPSYESIGIAAPILVLLLRLLQGLALGGEYGGAATYVAEHAPVGKRGYYTSWIQTTATLGLFIALGIILLVKSNMSDAEVSNFLEVLRRSMESFSRRINVIENGVTRYYAVESRGVGILKTERGKFWQYNFSIDDQWEKYSVIVKADLDKDLLVPVFKNKNQLVLRTDSGCETGQVSLI